MQSTILYKETHLVEENRINLACDYLVHEFRKIFRNLGYSDAYSAIKSLVPTADSDDVAIRDFWNLFCAISSGWRLKDLFNIITNQSIQWKKEKKSVRLFVPQDPQGWMKNVGHSTSFFTEATSYLKSDSNTLKGALEQSEKERGDRADGDENDPIIALEMNDTFEVRDGSSRLKVKIEKWLSEQRNSSPPEIEAWIGHSTNGESNTWIPTGSIVFVRDYFLSKYAISGLDIETFLTSISKLAVAEYKKRVKQ
jgi:hypothetical protein